jgi:hypothetical protein
MVDTNNYNEQAKKVKACKNNCGKSIYWNNSQNAYFEIDSQQKHVCPNWKPSITKSQEQLSQPRVNALDTREEILAEIVLKLDRLERKVDKLRGTSAIGYGEH